MHIEVFDIGYIWTHPLVAEFAVKIGPTKIYGYKLSHYVTTQHFYVIPPSVRVDGDWKTLIKWENADIAKVVEDKILRQFSQESGLEIDPIAFVSYWWDKGKTIRLDNDIWVRGCKRRVPAIKRKHTFDEAMGASWAIHDYITGAYD